jgi:CubicO group peptidase (beta-lactamase class C family)
VNLEGRRPLEPKGERLGEVDAFLETEASGGAFPGGVVAVVRGRGIAHLHGFGRLSLYEDSERVRPDTIYDLASLTKVVATTTLAMTLVEEGLDLMEPAGRFVPALRGGAKARIRVFDLLAHSSGLPAWAPLFQTAHGKDAFLEAIAGVPLEYAPGSRSLYSDLGFLALGGLVEELAGDGLEALTVRRVLSPLGMEETRFCPPPAWLARIAPTERDPWRGRLLHGEVHDENAFALGGVAPHAGLFGTATDLALFSRMLLGEGALGERRIVSPATVARFTARAGIPDSSRGLGWDTPSPGSSAGTRLTGRAFGHTGFTGTSLWVDPEKDLAIVLLTNRVHPTRQNERIRFVRSRLADLVVESFD